MTPGVHALCIKNSMLMIGVVFKILLNSIVCFLQFSSSYIQIWGIIKVEVFSRFYGMYVNKYMLFFLLIDKSCQDPDRFVQLSKNNLKI